MRSILREFFLAGWSVLDVHHAITHRPSGQRWQHSADRGVDNPGAWLAHRLSPWRQDGTVIRSLGQRQAGLVAQQRAEQRAERERHEALRRELAADDRHDRARQRVMALWQKIYRSGPRRLGS